jgi:hypothetical protein
LIGADGSVSALVGRHGSIKPGVEYAYATCRFIGQRMLACESSSDKKPRNRPGWALHISSG